MSYSDRFWSDDELGTALKLRADGYPWKYIGRHLGRNPRAVECAVHRHNQRVSETTGDTEYQRFVADARLGSAALRDAILSVHGRAA
jgi:hypothetical protein